MSSPFIKTLTSKDPSVFDRSIESLVEDRPLAELLQDCESLESFWRETDNLYLRVRALIFLYHLHRFIIPERIAAENLQDPDLEPCPIPYDAHRELQARNFEEAIESLLKSGKKSRLNVTHSSGLAEAYHALALQSLADQVKRSVRQSVGNQWMFRIGHPDDFPLRFRREMLGDGTAVSPWLIEQTPVRMDLSHSSWSDIFFLGMDRPEFAKVINVSVDLAITGSENGPVPPCLSALRVIDRPIIRLVSLDLENIAEIDDLATLFDFGRDYLGLLKAALIASGLVPPGMEGSRTPLNRLLERLVGPGRGIELVSWVRDIPKGSRLAVSTNLLGSLITSCMRATSQVASLDGSLNEEERRMVASRAILGEWLGGSGGGWQDSGGIWPGAKLIEGCFSDGRIAEKIAIGIAITIGSRAESEAAAEEVSSDSDSDPDSDRDFKGDFGSRGALLPRHTRLDGEYIPESSIRALEDSLVLIHGGMAANVGPILEMVTERYLLRNEAEWQARRESLQCTLDILEAIREGDIREMGRLTTGHFFGPLKTIIPWSSNAFTERMIEEVKNALGDAFWGFWMLGGMSGGGMGLIISPEKRDSAKPVIAEILLRLKREYERSLPFAMDPVLYDFKINQDGSLGTIDEGRETRGPGRETRDERGETGDNILGNREEISGHSSLVPRLSSVFIKEYLRFALPKLLQKHPSERTRIERADLAQVRQLAPANAETFLNSLVDVDDGSDSTSPDHTPLDSLLNRHGFDPQQHEQIREDLLAGRVGLRQNRLHPKTNIEDVDRSSLQFHYDRKDCIEAGQHALETGQCAVVTLAAGAGSRWTQGAGVVKALHPFAPFNGQFRSFLEVHLSKSQLAARAADAVIPHVVTTGYLTHEPISGWLDTFRERNPSSLEGIDLHLSPGKSVGLRFVPTVRDLRYAWYELPQEKLDEQAEKMRDSVRHALMNWAESAGEASDYRDNLPMQCLHPVGHWYEVPNLLLNGTLHKLLQSHPDLRVLLLHNIDTLGASLDPVYLGHHILSGAPLTYEVMQRKFEDVGGGLARVDGVTRLVEGFALPREEDEFELAFYNTATSWIDVDQLLDLFGLKRKDIAGEEMLPGSSRFAELQEAVRRVASRMPTYITIKETKKRWGRGQEDIFPVLQFERLWGDMSAYLPSQGYAQAGFIEVSRQRGQQLKDPAQLDAWSREGTLQWLEQELFVSH